MHCFIFIFYIVTLCVVTQSIGGNSASNVSNISDLISCDVIFENVLCLKNGAHVVLPPATPYGLIAAYSWDSGLPIDISGNGFHGSGDVVPAPGVVATSMGAVFSNNYIVSPIINLPNSFSLSVWFYAINDIFRQDHDNNEANIYCPIITKDLYGSSQAISISINLFNGSVQINLPSTNGIENFISNSMLKSQTWYKLYLTFDNGLASLYVDGIADSHMRLKGKIANNNSNFYFGANPYENPYISCQQNYILDDIYIYNYSLPKAYVQADSTNINKGFSSSDIEISCTNCTLAQAQQGCSNNYHVCTDIEISSYAFGIIKNLGLDSRFSHIHSQSGNAPLEPGIGICCCN